MYMTGFADEASPSLDIQTRVTKALGWRDIESRNVQVDVFPAGNIHDISDAAFDRLAVKLEAAGVRINCFGSAIGNWGKHIDAVSYTHLRAHETRHDLVCRLL